MKSRTKKLIVGLTVIAVLMAYPLISSGKSNNPSQIVLTANNTVNLNGEITDESVAETIQALQKLDSNSKKPIYLFIYSPGGSIQAGFELIEAVRGLNRPVDAVVLFGASMAFQLTQSLNTRNILQNGVLMSHRAAGGFQGSFGGQYPSQIDSRYAFWLQRLKELDLQTVSRTRGKQTLESYQKSYASESWMTGTQSVEQGYADAIVTVHCDKSLAGTDSKQASFMGMTFSYEISKCPLITAPLNVRGGGGDIAKIDPVLAGEIRAKFLDSFDLEKTVK